MPPSECSPDTSLFLNVAVTNMGHALSPGENQYNCIYFERKWWRYKYSFSINKPLNCQIVLTAVATSSTRMNRTRNSWKSAPLFSFSTTDSASVFLSPAQHHGQRHGGTSGPAARFPPSEALAKIFDYKIRMRNRCCHAHLELFYKPKYGNINPTFHSSLLDLHYFATLYKWHQIVRMYNT